MIGVESSPKRAPVLALLLGLAISPAPARAAEPSHRQTTRSQSGPELSLGLSWGDPHGQREAGADLAGVVVGQVPIEAALGVRTGFGLLGSAQARYGALIGRDCATSCSGSLVRIGFALEYHFTPDDRVDHYVGLGVGYEWLALDIGISRQRYRGPEWLSLHFGEEFPLGAFGIGPLLSFALGQYTHQESDFPPAVPVEGTIVDRMVHVWLLLGLRMSYGWPWSEPR